MSDPLILFALFCFSFWGLVCALFLIAFMHGSDLRHKED